MTNKNLIGSLFILISGLCGCSESGGPVDGTVDTSVNDGSAVIGGQSGTIGSCYACEGEEPITNFDEPLFPFSPSANEIYAAVEGTWLLSSYAEAGADYCERPLMTVTIERGSSGKKWLSCSQKIELDLNVKVTDSDYQLNAVGGALEGPVASDRTPVTDTPSSQVSVGATWTPTAYSQFSINVPGTAVVDGNNVDVNVVIDFTVSTTLTASVRGASLKGSSDYGGFARTYGYGNPCDAGEQSL